MGSSLKIEAFQIDGITKLEKEEDEIKFFYKGDINLITKAISSMEIRDLNIEEPTLEEVFMHYYE